MNQPLVSVAIISYNQGKFIQQMLDSLQAQTYKNWELIVADDASQDNSVEIYRNWLHTNNITAREVYHLKNTGLPTVLNELTEMCNGEYIKFMAADDYLHPCYLEKAIAKLEEKGHEYGMVFTDTFCVDKDSKLLPDIADYDKLGGIAPVQFRRELLKGNRIAALTVLLRTQVIRETGLYESKFIVEDYHRWLLINEKYYISYVPEKLAYYRLHPGNISKLKADRIDIEAVILQSMFDHKGIVKNKINDFMQGLYVWNKDIPNDLFQIYNNYPFRSKVLAICIQYKIPTIIYRMLFGVFLRLKLQLPVL